MATDPYSRACLVAGCPRPVHYRGRCQVHAREADGLRGLNADRRHVGLYASREWTALRRDVLAACPACQCGAGCGRASEVVHHVRPHGGNPALFFAIGNLRALSKACHDGITRAAQSRAPAGGGGKL